MGINVQFIYPNTYGMNMLPPAIAIFSSLLKKHGHNIQVFDTTYYAIDFGIDADGTKMERLNVVPFDMNSRGIRLKTTDWKKDLNKQLNDFKPDLIAVSSTEDMWELGMQILNEAKDYKNKNNIPVLVGGVFPTFAPEICFKEKLVDLVCVGEGENALLDLCKKIENNEDYSDVTNLWVKKDGKLLKKNLISKPVDINSSPKIDISIFEENRLYRPMAGRVYKMFPVETIRGCPYTCTFCNSPDQMALYKKETKGGYYRKKSMDLVYKELKYFKGNHGVEYNYFWADTFLSWNEREFDEFCEMYSDIRLPFWMQTRPETITEYKVKRLAEVGLHRISFGLEHGNEGFRKKLLRRDWKNGPIIDALKIPVRYGVPFSVNNITGFPTETRELAMDTVELNRYIDSHNQNLYSFVPFHGTPLRKICEDMGLVNPDTITKALTDKPMLVQKQYLPEEIEGLQKCFVLYVKLPKNRWKDIKRAESNTPEGEKIFEELKQEYTEKFFSTETSIKDASHNSPDLEYGLEI